MCLRWRTGKQWSESDEVDIMFSGVAYWDGVRHIWFGEEGYWYSLDDMSDQIEAFEYIKSLTILYCNLDK